MSSGTPLATRAAVIAAMTLAVLTPTALGKGFLADQPGKLRRGAAGSNALDHDLKRAIDEALGCGGNNGHESVADIKRQLMPMWRTMPKNALGRVDRRSMRYMVHRFFMQRSSLSIRGFELFRPTNLSSWSEDDILSQRVPAFVEQVLEGSHAELGFTQDDVATMVATLEQLIFDSESTLLEAVYAKLRKSAQGSLSKKQLHEILELYMVRWLVGGEAFDLEMSQTARESAIPHWGEVSGFIKGLIDTLEFQRQRAPSGRKARSSGADVLSSRFSFDDAHAVVGSITNSFGPYWESECQVMKDSLVSMDKTHTGRVRLSDFYGEALDSDWRFGESEAYLRQLGALDESSRWHGKQVIIPNYLQAVSNCIVTSQHYSVCCANECEGLMGEIEAAVREPEAAPERILAVVSNLTSPSTDDERPQIGAALKSQLQQIARTHGGTVPLHGRLFAQWLHYVFPRECPFPYKSGAVEQVAPAEFQGEYMATKDEMSVHAHGVENATAAWEAKNIEAPSDAHWMSQWSHEEELHADYTLRLRAPWEARHGLAGVAGLILCGVAISAFLRGGRSEPQLPGLGSGGSLRGKTHLV